MKFLLYKNGEYQNTIVGSEKFAAAYCEQMGFTYELQPDEPEPETEPTEMEQLRADVDYIAMEMGVDL